jgi:uncharacterized membrane protein YfcA
VALLVMVFALVNVTVLVLRRERVDHEHFRAPSIMPVIGVGISIALLTEIEGEIFARAGLILLLGVAIWFVNALLVRRETEGRR